MIVLGYAFVTERAYFIFICSVKHECQVQIPDKFSLLSRFFQIYFKINLALIQLSNKFAHEFGW